MWRNNKFPRNVKSWLRSQKGYVFYVLKYLKIFPAFIASFMSAAVHLSPLCVCYRECEIEGRGRGVCIRNKKKSEI